MEGIKIDLNIDNADPKNHESLKRAVEDGKMLEGKLTAITGVPGGMKSGKSSIAFIVEFDDGHVGFCETSMAIFLTAVPAFQAKYGHELD